jgi:hypothetical protein
VQAKRSRHRNLCRSQSLLFLLPTPNESHVKAAQRVHPLLKWLPKVKPQPPKPIHPAALAKDQRASVDSSAVLSASVKGLCQALKELCLTRVAGVVGVTSKHDLEAPGHGERRTHGLELLRGQAVMHGLCLPCQLSCFCKEVSQVRRSGSVQFLHGAPYW